MVMPNGAVAAGAQVAAQLAQINQQAVQMQNSAKSFVAAAGTGFHIEPQAAATLIKACQDALEELRHLDKHLYTVSLAPQLGQTPGARVVSPFTQQVAVDSQGMIPAIESLKKTLADMIMAYQKASTNYAETEAIIAQSLRHK
ncbi:MAG TPA: hypothetical protein VH352_15385 [Pseudonocardiaceae bacterium]|jgi:hypothetical protein|nr:hypothetical protein [Pseudonocardiaceae bacterium]